MSTDVSTCPKPVSTHRIAYKYEKKLRQMRQQLIHCKLRLKRLKSKTKNLEETVESLEKELAKDRKHLSRVIRVPYEVLDVSSYSRLSILVDMA